MGLLGEYLKIYTQENSEMVEWTDLTHDDIPSTFTWYKVNPIFHLGKTVAYRVVHLQMTDFIFFGVVMSKALF